MSNIATASGFRQDEIPIGIVNVGKKRNGRVVAGSRALAFYLALVMLAYPLVLYVPTHFALNAIFARS